MGKCMHSAGVELFFCNKSSHCLEQVIYLKSAYYLFSELAFVFIFRAVKQTFDKK